MSRSSIHILTYHSISDGAGPTCIAPSLFDEQLAAIAESGVACWTPDDYLEWRNKSGIDAKAVIVTFDDAFADYADNAHGPLRKRGFRAAMFVPTGHVGARADWDGAGGRTLMDWRSLAAAAQDGLVVGSHGNAHIDMTRLEQAALDAEIARAADMIEHEIGRRADYFAAPFGRADEAVRTAARKRHRAAAGVDMAVADRSSPLFNLPRIDMHYFRDAERLAALLRGDRLYFNARRAARHARMLALGIAGRAIA